MDAPELFPGESVVRREVLEAGWSEAKVGNGWAQPDYGEKTLLEDGTLLWTFVEDKDAKEEAPDPRRTPYFVVCPGGRGAEVYEEAHVEGSPEAPS